MFSATASTVARAQIVSQSGAPAPRIAAEVTSAQMSALPNSAHPAALAQYETGRLAADTKIQGMSIHFSRTQAQEADLQALMAAQQNPASPLYHQWLTPDQFAARFGMADADIAKVESWLEQQGFSVDLVNRSRNMIRFSGTARQVEQSFATEMHTYSMTTSRGVEHHFAPSTALSVPSALLGVIASVHNLDDFRPHPHLVVNKSAHAKPRFTGNIEGSQYVLFAPGDIATVYDINSEYQKGYTGSGQSIAIVGQSAIAVSDIEAFQSAAGLPVKDPNLIVVPDTGTPTVVSGDESESDLDLEWSGAIAKGATISFVYTGTASGGGAFDAIEYAIDQKIANIISSSYGTCEADLGGFSLESDLEQAASQGQTVFSAGGDAGSTDCFGVKGLTASQQETLAVDYPGSSPNVTSVGGTEVSGGDELTNNDSTTNTYLIPGDGYWSTESTTNAALVNSALKYIPEQAWNEDSTCTSFYNQGDGGSPLCSGGGGVSSLFSKPSWQTGVSGIPSDGKRDVPDISLNAAIYAPGYVYCTSDQNSWVEGQEASCNDGFLDTASLNPTVAGGTSFAAPIFAGMLALINQQQGYTTGQGPINATLYALASNSSTYASAFHDITSGNNDCSTASSYCSGSGKSDYPAGTGYDLATGLGSVDLYNLASAWPANTGTGSGLIATTTTVSATNTAPLVNTSDTFTITVSSDSGTPTGTVSIKVDSNAAVTETLTANGTVTYPYTFTTAGSHTVTAQYSGDSSYAGSTGSITVNVATVSSGKGSFSLAATPATLTVSQGNEGTETITATPSGGYTGTIDLAGLDSSNDNALQNLCIDVPNPLQSDGDPYITISGTSTANTTLIFDTNAEDCATDAITRKTGMRSLRSLQHRLRASSDNRGKSTGSGPVSFALAGLFLVGFLGRYSRKFRAMAGVIVLVAIGLAVTACGSGGSDINTISNPPKGTYTITITGQDTVTTSITAKTSFTFTID